MTRYMCTGNCQGVSDTPGVCQAADCNKHGEALHECNCAEGTCQCTDKEKEAHSHAEHSEPKAE